MIIELPAVLELELKPASVAQHVEIAHPDLQMVDSLLGKKRKRRTQGQNRKCFSSYCHGGTKLCVPPYLKKVFIPQHKEIDFLFILRLHLQVQAREVGEREVAAVVHRQKLEQVLW